MSKELKRGFCKLIRLELEFCPRVFEFCGCSRHGLSSSDTFVLPPRLSMFKMATHLKKHIK